MAFGHLGRLLVAVCFCWTLGPFGGMRVGGAEAPVATGTPEDSVAVAGTGAEFRADDPGPALLTDALSIRRLPVDDADRRNSVRLQGVVTFADEPGNYFFLQDETAGIYVQGGESGVGVKRGDRIVLEGVTYSGKFASIVRDPVIRLSGHGGMPQPALVTMVDLGRGRYDSLWVETRGVVRSVVHEGGDVIVTMAEGGAKLQVRLKGPLEEPPSGWVDSELRVSGVSSTQFDARRRLEKFQLLVPGLDQVEMEKPARVDPFDLPTRAIGQLLRFTPPESAVHRIKVEGTVSGMRGGRLFFVTDSANAVTVRTAERIALEVGDHVEVIGFPEMGRCAPEVLDASVRRVGKSPVPESVRVIGGDLFSRVNHANLVTTEGWLIDRTVRPGDDVLVLQMDGFTFPAILESSGEGRRLQEVRVGSLVRVTGTCLIELDPNGVPESAQVLLRALEDVEVLRGPPWWTLRYTVPAAGLGLGAAFAAIAWGVLLRRKLAQQAVVLRRNYEQELTLEQRYRELFENATDIVYTADLQGNVTSVNRAATLVLGYSREELLKLNLFHILSGSYVEVAHRMTERKLAEGGATTYRVEIIAKDGRAVPMELNTRLISASGKPFEVHGIGRDLTERLQSEESLLRSEQRFRKAFQATTVSSAVSTIAEGRVVDVNDGFLNLFGFEREEVIGKLALDLGIWADAGERSALMRDLQSGKGLRNVECRLISKSGARLEGLVSAEMIDFGGEPCSLVITHDITERTRLEVLLRNSQKMQAAGQLAAGLVHDFNNILTVIQGHASVLLSSGEFQGQANKSLSRVLEAAARASGLTRQLMAFSRKQAVHRRQINLNDLVMNLLDMLRDVVGSNVHLTHELAPDLPTVSAEVGMVEQVLINLAVNARDAMPGGGVLSIRSSWLTLEVGKMPWNPNAKEGLCVCLNISDTGGGMDREILSRAFEPYYSTKAASKGTGLGLSVVYAIMKQHDGWIEVESEVDLGTSFNLYFPASDVPAEALVRAATFGGILPVGNETILVVEDEESLLYFVAHLLQRQGYQVLQATSGEQAFEVWANRRADIDLVFTDIVMPGGISGLELAERLRAEDPGVKVLFTSGYHHVVENEKVAFQDGLNFVPKPYEPTKLATTVRNCLDAVKPVW